MILEELKNCDKSRLAMKFKNCAIKGTKGKYCDVQNYQSFFFLVKFFLSILSRDQMELKSKIHDRFEILLHAYTSIDTDRRCGSLNPQIAADIYLQIKAHQLYIIIIEKTKGN